MSKLDEILEKLRDSEISCMTDKRNEARADRLKESKLAILEVVRGTIPKRDSRNTQECKMIDSINSKIGGL